MKCPLCNEPVKGDHPGAVVYHMSCLMKDYRKARSDAKIICFAEMYGGKSKLNTFKTDPRIRKQWEERFPGAKDESQ